MNPFLYLYLAYFFCLDACVVVEDLPAGDVEDCGVFVVVVGAGVVAVDAGAGACVVADDASVVVGAGVVAVDACVVVVDVCVVVVDDGVVADDACVVVGACVVVVDNSNGKVQTSLYSLGEFRPPNNTICPL